MMLSGCLANIPKPSHRKKPDMKNILTIALCLFAAVTFAADPDATMPVPNSPITVASYSGTTTNARILSVSTNSYFTIGVSEQTELAMFMNFKYLNAVGAGDVNRIDLQLYRGVDASKFESNVWQTLTFVANATTTTANASMTNITVAGIPYLRGRFVNVSTNAHATNVLFQVRGKTSAVKVR